jgi:hypothetical protein
MLNKIITLNDQLPEELPKNLPEEPTTKSGKKITSSNPQEVINEQYLEELRFFLRMPLSATPVLDHFRKIYEARLDLVFGDFDDMERFVYIPATRENAVLLVAHADTKDETDYPTELDEDDDMICNADISKILGADDRAGCAIISILETTPITTGHGILITDGEEHRQRGARALMEKCPRLSAELQSRYQFMVEFDRRESRNFKCYSVGTDEFINYLERETGYRNDGKSSRTDICELAKSICGVNIAVGFHCEHYPGEYLVKSEWLEALSMAISWLGEKGLPCYRHS